jgi:hypothetical protein
LREAAQVALAQPANSATASTGGAAGGK